MNLCLSAVIIVSTPVLLAHTTNGEGVTEDKLCAFNSCEVDANCTGSNVCIYHSCAIDQGMVEDGCPCETDGDCKSKDCIVIDLLDLDFRCAVTNNGGEGENEEGDDPPSPPPTFTFTNPSDDVTKEGWPILDLNDNILYKSAVAANLSSLAYLSPTLWVSDETNSGFSHPDYETITFYTDEPDQAIVARKNGICYLAFRGTDQGNPNDVLQNLDLDDITIYRDNDDTTNDFCIAREGFAEFIFSSTATQGLLDLENCLSDCDKDDCLVITGHSQGGASASIAAILLHRYDPTIITFGQPPTIDRGCEWINSKKYYRYVNSRQDGSNSIGFDVVVDVPSGSGYYGYFILLGESKIAVKYLGFDNDYSFFVSLEDFTVSAHLIDGEPYSYQNHILNLVSNAPISTDGFEEGHICEREYAKICASGSCVEERCIPVGGIDELCLYNSCEKDSDCAGDNVCIYDSCATGPGMVENGCFCLLDRDCKSNFCNSIDLLSLDFRCTFAPSASAMPSCCGNILTSTITTITFLVWLWGFV